MPSKIEAHNLRAVYKTEGQPPVVALDGLDLQVHDKEFLAIVGPSGCGKSTLLYLIAGFLELTAGELRLNNQPITGPRHDCGIVFQHFALFPWKTVKGNILYGLDFSFFELRRGDTTDQTSARSGLKKNVHRAA